MGSGVNDIRRALLTPWSSRLILRIEPDDYGKALLSGGLFRFPVGRYGIAVMVALTRSAITAKTLYLISSSKSNGLSLFFDLFGGRRLRSDDPLRSGVD
jgi:hypothetical protein